MDGVRGWQRVVGALVGLALLGGCVLTGSRDGEGAMGADERRIDGGPVLVPAEVWEQLGYERPEAQRNPAVMRLALANREQIYGVVQPYLESMLGREVVLTGMSADRPSRAVGVQWRTVDEPVVSWSELVGLERDGTLFSDGSIARPTMILDHETVSGLYLMAYRAEVEALRAYLETTYPELTALPSGYAEAATRVDPMLWFQLEGDGEEFARWEEATSGVFEAYGERPVRSDREWRKVFEVETAGVGAELVVTLMLRDPDADLSEDRLREIAHDLADNPLLGRARLTRVVLSSNLMVRDSFAFHHELHLGWSDHLDDWYVQEWRDGGTVVSW